MGDEKIIDKEGTISVEEVQRTIVDGLTAISRSIDEQTAQAKVIGRDLKDGLGLVEERLRQLYERAFDTSR